MSRCPLVIGILALTIRFQSLAEEAPAPVAPPPSAIEREIAKWTQATERWPEKAMPWAHLGNAYMQKSREVIVGDHYRQAESAFLRSLALDAGNVEATVGMAWVFNSRHDFERGVEWARRAIALDAANQDAYALLADAAVELGNYEEALEHCQKCLDIAPNLSSYSRAAHVLFLTGDGRKARWLMQKAVNAGGPYAENTAWCRAHLALMLFDAGALEIADQQLDEAVKATPDNRHVLAAMATVKTAKKEYEAAIGYCRRALAILPDHDALVQLGDLYALVGKRDDAERTYERVIKLHGGHSLERPEVHTHLSGGNAQLARFYADHDRNLDEALAEAEKAYEKYRSVFVADTLAWCLYKKERYDEALGKIKEAMRYGTPKADFLFHAGMIHAASGHRETARRLLNQALSLNPRFHPTQAELAVKTLKELSAGSARSGSERVERDEQP